MQHSILSNAEKNAMTPKKCIFEFVEKKNLQETVEKQITTEILDNIPCKHPQTETHYFEPTIEYPETIEQQKKMKMTIFKKQLKKLIELMQLQPHKKARLLEKTCLSK